jgi:hypothetical protein
MTATLVIVQKRAGAVHLISDGAVYDPSSGIVQFFHPKAFALPHLPGAIAARGPHRAADLIGAALAAAFSSFDDLIAGIEDELPLIIEEDERLGYERIDLTIAGWSARTGRPEAYFLNTQENDWRPDDDSAGELVAPPAFKCVKLADMVIAPSLAPEDIARVRTREWRDQDDVDPVVDGFRILELQRQKKYTLVPDGPEAHWIGGFGLLTTVTKDGVNQRVIGRWNDLPDALIEPSPAAETKPPAGMSRLQRNIYDRKQRKAGKR